MPPRLIDSRIYAFYLSAPPKMQSVFVSLLKLGVHNFIFIRNDFQSSQVGWALHSITEHI